MLMMCLLIQGQTWLSSTYCDISLCSSYIMDSPAKQGMQITSLNGSGGGNSDGTGVYNFRRL